MKAITLEILEGNYWEHFKVEKDLSLILPVDHHKRVRIRESMDNLLKQIHSIKNGTHEGSTTSGN